MAESKTDLDRSEPATAHKLEKARERGSIFRSADLTFAGVLGICIACVFGLGLSSLQQLGLLVRQGLALSGHDDLTQPTALALLQTLGRQALLAGAPLLFAVWLTALLVAAMQARGVFTAEPLKPDFNRLNPAAGFARLFSVKSLHELWRNAAKLGLITLAMVLWGRHALPAILHLQYRAPRSLVTDGVSLLGSALCLLAGVISLCALVEWSLNRWDYLRNLRMSKREIKDEHKEREGDPRIKSRLRELRLAWLKRARQLSKVRDADVLLTNPTHYAVALRYRPQSMPAPTIIARGAGEMAQRMRQEAQRRAVPVVVNPPLTRALFGLDEAQVLVPEEHFVQVARILRWVYAARGAQPQ